MYTLKSGTQHIDMCIGPNRGLSTGGYMPNRYSKVMWGRRMDEYNGNMQID